jgi:hypothetical protein
LSQGSVSSRREESKGVDREEERRREGTYTETSLATIGAIVVGEGTDDLVVGIGDGEGAGQGGSGRHGELRDHVSDLSCGRLIDKMMIVW